MKKKNALLGVIIIAFLITLVLVAATFTELYVGREIPFQIVAAFISVAMMGVVTWVLLNGQSRAEEEKDKSVKVFQEKLKVYKKYFEELCKVLETRKISDEQQIKLQFQIALIAMHTPYDKIEKISASLEKMLQCIKGQKGQGQGDMVFMEDLLGIVGTFKSELYSSDSSVTDQNDIERIIANLKESFKDTDTDGGPASDNADCTGEIKEGLLDELKVEPQYRNKRCWQQGPDWSYCKLFSDGLKWTNKHGQSVEIGFYQGHYYIQANYPNATEFAKTMKWRYGGRRSYGQWWKHLEAVYDIKQGKFLEEFSRNGALQKIVTEECCKLMADLESYGKMDEHRRDVEKSNPRQDGVFYYFIWEFEILCCQFESEVYRNPFIDMQWDGNKVNISIGNRSDDIEKLKDVLGDLKANATLNGSRYELKIDESELKEMLPMYSRQIHSVIEKK